MPGLQKPGAIASIRSLALFMLFGSAPVVLVITLLALVYLAFLELRKRPLSRQARLAWLLFVFLTHALGYLALLAYLHLYLPRREPS